jgi:adenosylhomocysteine nucleosidase
MSNANQPPQRQQDSLLRRRKNSAGPRDREGWITVLFALPEETRPFRKRLQSFPTSSHVYLRCSGVGAERAASTADDVAVVAAPGDVLLICGFAGGLTSEMKPGSLIVADSVIDHLTGQNYKPDSELLYAAESVRLSGVSVQRGTLMTGNRVLVTAGEKRQFAEQSGGVAVDMESAGAAQVAQKYGVPWLAVRAITDGVDDDLPLDFNALADASGNVHRGRILLATLTHPWKIPALIRLGKRSSLAAENLAAFLEALLPHLPERKL